MKLLQATAGYLLHIQLLPAAGGGICALLCANPRLLYTTTIITVYLKTLYIFISLIYKDDPLGDVVDNLVFS